jgi:hypothetical protein
VEFVANRILTVSPLRVSTDEETTALTEDRVSVMAAGLVWLITQWLKRDSGGADSIAAMTDRLVAVMESFGTASASPATDTPTSTDEPRSDGYSPSNERQKA